MSMPIMQLHVLDFSPLSRLCRNVLLKSLRIHFQPQQFESSTISDTSRFGISSQPLLLYFL